MTDTFFCPRALENGGGPDSPFKPPMNGETKWKPRDGHLVCGYCGSLHPDEFMKAAEEGVEIGPTDKSYKAYLDVPDPGVGAPTIYSSANFPQTGEGWVEITPENRDELPLDPWQHANWPDGHWVKVEPRMAKTHAKFYFQHLSPEQRTRFVELINERKMKVGMPGHFYVLPFFCKIVK